MHVRAHDQSDAALPTTQRDHPFTHIYAHTSHVLYNPAVRRFLDSYLRHCTRPYEACLRAAAAPTTTTTTSPVPAANQGSEALRRTLSMLVLLLHLRLCTDAGAVDALGPKPDTLLRSTLDVPKALDLAALYGFTEPALLSRCLQAACRLRPSLAKPELSAALSASATVLADVGRVLAHAVEAEQQQREEQLLDDRLEYLADVTAALSRLAIAVPDQVAPAFTDGEGAGPKVLLALRGLYGRLVQLEGAGDGPLPAEGGALSVEALLVRGRRRRADARFARKCIVALVGAVVDGVVAVAAQAGRVGPGRAMAAEGLFTLVGGLLNAGSEEEGGPEEGRMMQDCIHQCPGGLRERVRKLLLLLSDGEDDEAAGSVQYLLQLLEAAAEVGREEAEARRQRRAGTCLWKGGPGFLCCASVVVVSSSFPTLLLQAWRTGARRRWQLVRRSAPLCSRGAGT